MKMLNRHLRDTGESYWKHGFFAFKWGLYLMVTGFISMAHGLLPFLWPFKAPERVMRIARIVKEKHPEIYRRYF